MSAPPQDVLGGTPEPHDPVERSADGASAFAQSLDQPMSLSFHLDTSTLVVAGCVEEDEAVSLRAAIADHSDDHTRDLVVDLSEVNYFPSAAVGVVARAQARSREAGVTLDLVAREGCITERVLKICGVPHRTDSAQPGKSGGGELSPQT